MDIYDLPFMIYFSNLGKDNQKDCVENGMHRMQASETSAH